MRKYFTNCKTAEDLKQEYKRLAKMLHPDCNRGKDTTAEFQKMQAEFDEVWIYLKNIHVNKDGESYTKETDEKAADFREMINALLKIKGINVEMCGSWLWITGDTKNAKEKLKALNCRWSRNKGAWYYHFGAYHKTSKKSMSLEAIRFMYGSRTFSADDSDLVF